MSSHRDNDAIDKVPSSLHDSTILKLVCNGLRNVERTHDTVIIDLGNEPSSLRVNGHYLPMRPIKKPLLLVPHFIQNISLNPKLEQRDKHPIPFSMDGFKAGQLTLQ